MHPETLGDLWHLAGKKAQTCRGFIFVMEDYKEARQFQAAIRAEEKILKMNTLYEGEEVAVLEKLVECYECRGQLHDVV